MVQCLHFVEVTLLLAAAGDIGPLGLFENYLICKFININIINYESLENH